MEFLTITVKVSNGGSERAPKGHQIFVGSPALNLGDGPLRPAPAGLFFAGPSKRQAKLPISSRYSVNYDAVGRRMPTSMSAASNSVSPWRSAPLALLLATLQSPSLSVGWLLRLPRPPLLAQA